MIQPLKTLLLALILSIGVSYAYATWAPPTATPTGGNAEAPVNVGSAAQIKTGGLSVNGLFRAFNSAYFATDPGSRVGIGTTNPKGSLTIDNSNGVSWLDIRGTGDGYNYSAISFWSNESGNWNANDKRWAIGHRKTGTEKNNFFIEECTQPGSCIDGTGDYDQRLTIKPGGNVGIGVVSPATKLDVAGAIHSSGDVCTDQAGGKCLSSAGGGAADWSSITNRPAGLDDGDDVGATKNPTPIYQCPPTGNSSCLSADSARCVGQLSTQSTCVADFYNVGECSVYSYPCIFVGYLVQ